MSLIAKDRANLCFHYSYKKLNKPELQEALEGELKANATKYSNRPRLSAYYNDTPADASTDITSRVKSPIKNTVQSIQKAVGAVTSDEDAPKKTSRRKTTGGPSDT